MITPRSTTKIMISSSTQVTLESIARELADCESKSPCGYVMKKEEAVKVDNKRSIKMVDQGTETDDLATDNSGRVIVGPPRPLLSSGRENVLEFSLLRLVFPNIETVVLRHQLEMSNYKEVFQMMMSLKEDTVNPPHIIDDNSILFDENDSETYSEVFFEEEMDQERILFEYLINESNEMENDEQLAFCLDQDWNANLQTSEIVEENANFEFLCNIFSNTNREKIQGAFDASGNNLDLARTILLDEGEKEVTGSADTINWNETVTSPKATPRVLPKMTKKEKSNIFLNRKSTKQTNLEEVQKNALEERKRIGSIQNGKSLSPPRSPRNAVSKEIRAIDLKIREAHQNPWYLDLHYMSVEGAVSLVNEAIEAARYIIKSKRRASTKIKVVTGSGNNSRHGPKIRPEIEAFLRKCNISYDVLNTGCLVIKLD